MTTCPNCGTPVSDEDLFCGGCGQRLPRHGERSPLDDAPAQRPSSVPSMPGPPPLPPEEYASQQPTSQPAHRQPAPPGEDRASSPPPPTPPVQATGAPPPPSVYEQEADRSPEPRKKRRRSCLIGLAIFGALMLCGLTIAVALVVLSEFEPDVEPPAIPYSSSSDTESPLVVINNSNASICNLYISPSESGDWGADWLSDLGSIDPGFSATFYLTVGETVDMQIEDCDGYVVGREFDVTVPAEGLTYTVES